MTTVSLNLQKAVRIPFSTPLLVNFVLYCHHHTAVIICIFCHWESALPPPPPPPPPTIMVDWASLFCHPSLAVVLLLALSTCSIVVHLFCHCPFALLFCFVSVLFCHRHSLSLSCFVIVTLSLSCLSSSLLCHCPACHHHSSVIVLLCHRHSAVIVLLCHSAQFLSCFVIPMLCHCPPALSAPPPPNNPCHVITFLIFSLQFVFLFC